MNINLTILFCILCLQLVGQPLPDWTSSIPTNFDLYIRDKPHIKHTSNGELIVVGNTLNSTTLKDILIIKYDSFGNIIWQQVYDNIALDEEAVDFELDLYNNIYITGTSSTDSLNSDILTIKYDQSGNFKWMNTFNGIGNREDKGNSLTIDSSDNIYVTGYATVDSLNLDRKFVIHKIDSSGNTCWSQYYGLTPNSWSEGKAIRLVNNFLMVSGSSTFPIKYVVAKLDTSGSTIFFNENLITKGVGKCFIDHLGNFYFGSPVWYKLTKVNSSGLYAWEDSIPTNLPSNVTADELRNIAVDTLLNVYTTGRHYGPNFFDSTCTKADILTVKYAASGSLLWQQRYSHMAQNTDIGNCVFVDENLNVYSGGFSSHNTDTSEYDYVVVKYDQLGNNTGLIRYNSSANENDVIYDMNMNDTNCIYITGVTFSNLLSSTTTQKYCNFSGVGLTESSDIPIIKVFPNPFSTSITIENKNVIKPLNVRLYDAIGVEYYYHKKITDKITISTNKLQNGIYFILVDDTNSSNYFKIVKTE